MNIVNIKRELNLIYYGYDEENKAFLTKIDSSVAIKEFPKILEKLEEYKINYNIVNMSYIKVEI